MDLGDIGKGRILIVHLKDLFEGWIEGLDKGVISWERLLRHLRGDQVPDMLQVRRRFRKDPSDDLGSDRIRLVLHLLLARQELGTAYLGRQALEAPGDPEIREREFLFSRRTWFTCAISLDRLPASSRSQARI